MKKLQIAIGLCYSVPSGSCDSYADPEEIANESINLILTYPTPTRAETSTNGANRNFFSIEEKACGKRKNFDWSR